MSLLRNHRKCLQVHQRRQADLVTYKKDTWVMVNPEELAVGIMLKLVCRMKMAASLATLSKMLQKPALRARVFKSTYMTMMATQGRRWIVINSSSVC